MSVRICSTLFLVGSMLISACGDGGSGNDQLEASVSGTTPPNSSAAEVLGSLQVGLFNGGPPVQGLSYRTATQSGTTDNQGRFAFYRSEAITFSIGDLVLGNAVTAQIMSPLSLTQDSLNETSVGIVRLLISLDQDSQNPAVIRLPETLTTLQSDMSSFGSEASLNDLLNKAANLTGQQYTLVPAAIAEESIRYWAALYAQYKPLSAGVYTGSGDVWYVLNMPNSGNVDIYAERSGVETTLFDTALNPVNTTRDPDSSLSVYNYFTGIPAYLEAGTFLVKAKYKDTSSKTITVNSPVLFDQELLPELANGQYTGNGVVWYKLRMITAGNLAVSTSPGVTATLHDQEMNPVNTLDTPGIYHYITDTPVFLNTGTYLVKAYYYGGDKTMTVNLPIVPKQ